MSNDMPDTITPVGLTQARKEYLYSKIRQYVSDEVKDKLCPKPAGRGTSTSNCAAQAN